MTKMQIHCFSEILALGKKALRVSHKTKLVILLIGAHIREVKIKVHEEAWIRMLTVLQTCEQPKGPPPRERINKLQ